MIDPNVIQNKLLALREEYLANLPERLTELGELWDQYISQANAEALTALQRHAHSLAGSGATFGFTDISSNALDLDSLLKNISATEGASISTLRDPTLRESIASKIGALKQASNLALTVSQSDNTEDSQAALQPLASVNQQHNKDVVMYINVNTDTSLDHELLQQFHYHLISGTLTSLKSIPQLLRLIEQHKPSVLIYDIDDYSAENVALLDALNRQLIFDTPKMFISQDSSITPRLSAVRHGSDAFFMKPVEISALVERLDSYGKNQSIEPYCVMIIEDSPNLANAYAMFLELAGMKTKIVNDPLTVCEALCEFIPDLILLDMYMPNCSGPELAMVIRQTGSFTSVPIVFLSVESDIAQQLNAMRRGGDDFLTKPITPEHLVSAVKIRAKRYRDLRVYMVRDSLTGLLNHSKTVEHLHIEMSRAERHREQLAYVMLDIDRFKSINDNYGHAAGDQVIRSLAHLLQRSVRSTDIVGRYGGEEFAIVLYGTNWEAAFDVMENLRTDFEKMDHIFNNQTINVTFSCGIAIYPEIKEAEALQREADRALYEAKNQGRNRTILARQSTN